MLLVLTMKMKIFKGFLNTVVGAYKEALLKSVTILPFRIISRVFFVSFFIEVEEL